MVARQATVHTACILGLGSVDENQTGTFCDLRANSFDLETRKTRFYLPPFLPTLFKPITVELYPRLVLTFHRQ